MVIGISGKIGSGKDTIGEIIQYLTSPNVGSKGTFTECKVNGFVYDVIFENRKFADKLKDMVCMLLGCTRERLEDRNFKESVLGEEWWYYKHLTPKGTILLDYLTYKESFEFDSVIPIKLTPRLLLQLLGTECGRDILHPNLWVNALMSEYVSFPNFVVTDMRFKNEADAVRNKQGITIRVNRGSEIRENEHASETGLDNYDNWDYVVENNGSIEDLVEKVRSILKNENII